MSRTTPSSLVTSWMHYCGECPGYIIKDFSRGKETLQRKILPLLEAGEKKEDIIEKIKEKSKEFLKLKNIPDPTNLSKEYFENCKKCCDYKIKTIPLL